MAAFRRRDDEKIEDLLIKMNPFIVDTQLRHDRPNHKNKQKNPGWSGANKMSTTILCL